jgi:hypothetical protein
MRQRNSGGVCLLLAVVFVGVIISSHGWTAECGSDNSFLYSRTSAGDFVASAYKIDFLGVAPVPDPNASSGIVYKWTYGIQFAGANSEYDIAVPACNNGCEEGVIYSGGPSISVLPPGTGDKNTNWLVGNFQSQVVQLPASSSSGNSIYFYTSKLSIPAATSMQVKSGKTLYYVKDILGPTCPVDSLSPWTTNQEVTISGNSYLLIRNRFGCIKQVFQDGDPIPLQPVSLTIGEDGSTEVPPGLLLCSSTEGKGGCNECIITTLGGSPHYTYFTINGVPYKSKPFCLTDKGEKNILNTSGTIADCVHIAH